MALDFKVDSVLLDYQPTDIRVQLPEAKTSQTLDGGYLASERTKGAIISVSWGVDSPNVDAIAELVTARGGTSAHTIEFTDPAGTTWTFDVQWLSDPPLNLLVSYDFGRFTLTFYERP